MLSLIFALYLSWADEQVRDPASWDRTRLTQLFFFLPKLGSLVCLQVVEEHAGPKGRAVPRDTLGPNGYGMGQGTSGIELDSNQMVSHSKTRLSNITNRKQLCPFPVDIKLIQGNTTMNIINLSQQK
jgi:hypothetical protein